MQSAASNLPLTPPEATESLIRMPLGLLGFERIKEYALVANPAEDPFLWLQVPDDPSLAFLAINPLPFLPEYKPEISPEDTDFLELATASDIAVLSIVTLRGPNAATLNLKGPIILNRRTHRARQIIPVNAAEFSVQHPLPVSQA